MASGARGLTAEERGYRQYTGTQFNYSKGANGYMQTLLLEKDDCAMACDNEPTCRSFQTFNNGLGRNTCVLYNKQSSQFTGGQPDSSQKDMKHFDKTSSTLPPESLARLFTFENPKDIQNGYRNGADNITLNEGGLFFNQCSDCTTCDDPNDWCDWSWNPSGIMIAGQNQPRGVGANAAALQLHTGIKACNRIPGLVVNTVPTNSNGTDRPWTGNDEWANDARIYCGYNKINNDWIIRNWDNLNTYLTNTTNINYTVPKRMFARPDGSDQIGITKVDSVKVAKNDYCSTVPLTTFKDPNPEGKCKTFIQSQGGGSINDWYKFLADRAANENWLPATSVIRDACRNPNSTTQNSCQNAIINLTKNENYNSSVVNDLNIMTTSDSTATGIIADSIKNKIEDYCATRQDADECKCRNAVKYSIQNCRSDIKGCEDLMEYKKVRDAVSDVNSPLYTFLNTLQPRVLAQACKTADADNSGILRYGNTKGMNVELNQCVFNLKNEGNLTADKIQQTCKIQSNQGGTGTGAGGGGTGTGGGGGTGTGGDGTDGTTSNTWIWILVIGVILIFMSLSGAGAFVISQQ